MIIPTWGNELGLKYLVVGVTVEVELGNVFHFYPDWYLGKDVAIARNCMKL